MAGRALKQDDQVGNVRHISASQLKQFFDCEQKWTFRKVLRIEEPYPSFFAIGNAIDDAATIHNKHKKATHENTPKSEVAEIAVSELEKLKDATVWYDPFFEVKDEIPGLMGTLWDGSLSVIQPTHVQPELRIDMGDWEFFGYLDVIDENGIRRDYKTAKRAWPRGKELTEMQPVIYTLDAPDVVSTFAWDVAVRNKTPKLQQITRAVTPAAKRGMKTMAGMAKSRMDQIRNDADKALPTGYGGMMCSKRFCGFWAHCQKRWGHPIKD